MGRMYGTNDFDLFLTLNPFYDIVGGRQFSLLKYSFGIWFLGTILLFLRPSLQPPFCFGFPSKQSKTPPHREETVSPPAA